MFRRTAAVLSLSLIFVQFEAAAQVSFVDGKYRKDNVVRVYVQTKPQAPPGMAYKLAMLKIAAMTGAKNFSRFAVTNTEDCGTLLVMNVTVAHSCKLLARMLNPNEAVEQKGKQPVRYFSLRSSEHGIFVPEPEATPD